MAIFIFSLLDQRHGLKCSASVSLGQNGSFDSAGKKRIEALKGAFAKKKRDECSLGEIAMATTAF